MTAADLVDRIVDRLALDEHGCWLWTLATVSGYGRIWERPQKKGGKFVRTHRVLFEHFRGAIPEGMELDHLCRVRACANPWHLEVVTHRENSLRGDSPPAQRARQTHCIHGHPLDENNTYVRKEGWRMCRTCLRDAARRRRLEIAA